jgi:hypothetical protein
VEIYLGHHGSPCPSRTDEAEADEPPSESGSEGFDPDNDSNWEDEWAEFAPHPGFGLPKLKGEDACVVVDKSGVHRLRIRPCRCAGAPSDDLQFLDLGLFPSTLRNIKTVFTFGVLDDFRMDNLECKTAGMNYYNKLKRLTSNAFPESVPVSTFHDIPGT